MIGSHSTRIFQYAGWSAFLSAHYPADVSLGQHQHGIALGDAGPMDLTRSAARGVARARPSAQRLCTGQTPTRMV
jgi:hypothetical protein